MNYVFKTFYSNGLKIYCRYLSILLPLRGSLRPEAGAEITVSLKYKFSAVSFEDARVKKR